jgi:hypothetical protein
MTDIGKNHFVFPFDVNSKVVTLSEEHLVEAMPYLLFASIGTLDHEGFNEDCTDYVFGELFL